MKFSLKFGCFMLMLGFNGWSFSESCFDDEENLPKGSYLKAHCDKPSGGNCIDSEFEFDTQTDSLRLTSVTLRGFFEKVAFEKKINLMEIAGDKVLPDACKWVKAGFDIDYHIENLEAFQFMLTPRQPEPDYEIKDGKVVANKFKELDLFLTDVFTLRFDKSCPEFKLYIQPDVIFYRCNNKSGSSAGASIMPYFYEHQKNSTASVVLENRDGVLTTVKVIQIKNTVDYVLLDFNREIEQQCALRGMLSVTAPGGNMCHTISSGLLSKHLQESREHAVYIDIDSGYSVLHNCGDEAHLDILMNIKECFRHSLRLDYNHEHHRLFCMPGEFLTGLKDEHEEL